jgi:SAM-dependent methyltransferase
MLICPNCSISTLDAATGICPECKWHRIEEGGLHNYLTEKDRQSSLIEEYIDNYEALAKKNLVESNIDRKFLKNQAVNLMRYLSPVSGMKVCDIGIGQGFLCDLLLDAGVDSIAAVDVSRSFLARFINYERVTPYLANAEFLPFKNEFDLLVSTDVMEHVINVGSFLYCVNRALKMHGIAAIRVPYREGLLNYSPHMGYGHQFGHLRSFDKGLLRLYMEQAGFAVKSIRLDGFSTGTPQPYLYSTTRRKNIYHWLLKHMNKRLAHPADATLWNSHFAKLIMRPVELVVIAEKKREVAE